MELVAFRLAGPRAPLRVRPSAFDGRFHRAGDPPVQYFSLHPLTPWAELLRRENRRGLDEALAVRFRVWAFRVVVQELLEISFATARDAGVRPADLIADDRSACQGLARRLREPGPPAPLVVPSAALPGTRNLVMFGPRVPAPYDVQPVDATYLPSAVAGDHARTLSSLLPLVRFRGRPHAEYQAWRRRRPFEFFEPR
ncbi:MAG TPA: RES family NAD+ phosphorylase [Actinomycetota bacterium]